MARLLIKEKGLYIEAETEAELLFFKENSSDLIDYLSYHYERIVNQIKNSPIHHASDQTNNE